MIEFQGISLRQRLEYRCFIGECSSASIQGRVREENKIVKEKLGCDVVSRKLLYDFLGILKLDIAFQIVVD